MASCFQYHYSHSLVISGREVAVTTVIVCASFTSDSKQSLHEEEERPRVAQAQDYLCSKAENKKKMAQICCLVESHSGRESYCLVPSRSPASALPRSPMKKTSYNY